MKFAPGAWRYAAPPLALGLLCCLLLEPIGLLGLALGVAVLAFFRDPDRTSPPSGVLAPADGRISVIREEGDRVRVGTFLNVTNVHVARAPMDGTAADVTHRPGAHRPAFSKDSDRNERVDVDFETHDVSFIAGWFARRIHPYVDPGERVSRGQRIGHIDFGSRVDVLLPPRFDAEDLLVEQGTRVRAGKTVLVSSESTTAN